MFFNDKLYFEKFIEIYKGCYSIDQYKYFLKNNDILNELNFDEYFIKDSKKINLKVLFFIDFDKFIENKLWYSILNEKYMKIVLNYCINNKIKLKSIYYEKKDIYSEQLKNILQTENIQLINRMNSLNDYKCKKCNNFYTDIRDNRNLKCFKCNSIKCEDCNMVFFHKKNLVEHMNKIHDKKFIKNKNVEIYCIKCKNELKYKESFNVIHISKCKNKNCDYTKERNKNFNINFSNTIKNRDKSIIRLNYVKASYLREQKFKETIESNGLTKKENIMNSCKDKISNALKEKIKNGNFTPCVTNSWSNSKCLYKDKNFRSTWELIFYIYNEQIFNINLNYEKERIQYLYKNNQHNYIVDFSYDNQIYEIKPSNLKEKERNLLKTKYAKKWCIENNYKYFIISENWFKKNIKEIEILIDRLKLFFDENTYRKLNKTLKGFKK